MFTLQVNNLGRRILLQLNHIPLLKQLLSVKECQVNNRIYWNSYALACLRGKPFLKARYRIGPEIYLGRDVGAQLSAIQSLIRDGLIPKISRHSTILESGCNAANLLWKLKAEFLCDIVGVDNDSESLEVAKELAFRGTANAKFFVADVLDTDLFDRYPENFFTHCFCISHLCYLPNGEKKERYIDSLKRISQCVVLYERIGSKDDIRIKTKRYFKTMRPATISPFTASMIKLNQKNRRRSGYISTPKIGQSSALVLGNRNTKLVSETS